MDRELVKTVTKLVVEVLHDMNQAKSEVNKTAVKIWSHKSPLPDPIELTHVKAVQPENLNKIVSITPYVK